jgi:RNA polymerase sigma factor (sigma-70 family)
MQHHKGQKKLDEAKFEEVFLQHYRSLFALAFKMCSNREMSKDVIQSLFLEIWENRHQMNEVTYWNAYLRKSLYRKMLLELKQKHTTNITFDHEKHHLSDPSYEDLLIQLHSEESTRQSVQSALQQLPDQERTVLELRFLEGLSYEEIASNSGKSKQTIYNQVFNALKKLRNILGMYVLLITYLLP